jgi:hypothetical protein
LAAAQGIEPRLARSERAVLPLDEAAIVWCRQDGIEPPSAAYGAAVLPLNDAGEIGVTYGDRTRRDAFTARRVLQFTKATMEMEVRAGLEPAYSRFAGGGLAFRTIAPLSEQLAPAEANRTLLRGFGVRVVPRTRRYRIGSPRWDRTSLVPG